jgi:hypothetical protein
MSAASWRVTGRRDTPLEGSERHGPVGRTTLPVRRDLADVNPPKEWLATPSRPVIPIPGARLRDNLPGVRVKPAGVAVVLLGALASLTSSCTDQTVDRPNPPTSVDSSPSSAPVSTASCQQTLKPSPYALPEFKGRSDSSVSLYGLIFSAYPLPAGREDKIVWRMTGKGLVRFTATGPQGQRVAPVWGPEPHGSSDFARPGDEWGTAFRFPTRGCWTVHATRGTASATAALLVR